MSLKKSQIKEIYHLNEWILFYKKLIRKYNKDIEITEQRIIKYELKLQNLKRN